MPYDVPPDLDSLSLTEIAQLAQDRKLPPVASWEPEHSGHSEMRIAADGTWYHQDGEIRRPAMVRAFSSLLRREGKDDYWLVTPQQKLWIKVEDAPFIATEMTHEGSRETQRLAFRVNSDDVLVCGPEHALTIENRGAGPMPYLHVRDDLWAKLARPVFYELTEIALANAAETGDDEPAVWSDGMRFSLAAML